MKTELDRIAKDTNFFLKKFLKQQNNSKLIPAMNYLLLSLEMFNLIFVRQIIFLDSFFYNHRQLFTRFFGSIKQITGGLYSRA